MIKISYAKFQVMGTVESIRNPRDKTTVVVVEVDSSYKKKGGDKVERTSLTPIECYGDWAHDLIEGVSVGDVIIVEGEIDGRDYQGKVYSTLKPKSIKHVGERAPQQSQRQTNQPTINEDDIPF
jgi:single-stranded DNA-binding protein